MQMCLEHWNNLRKEIKDAGLEPLVSQSGEEVTKKIASEIADGPSIDNFDPLIGAMLAIFHNCVQVYAGVAAHPGCPLCFINENNPYGHDYDQWINTAAQEQLTVWRERGL